MTAADLHNQAVEMFASTLNQPIAQNQATINEAIALLTQAIEKDGDMAYAYINRRVNRATMGSFDLALADYDQAIAINPTGIAYKNKAKVLEPWGQTEAALDNYEMALSVFRISTKAIVAAANDLDGFQAAADSKKKTRDPLYSPTVASTVAKVVELRTQFQRPMGFNRPVTKHRCSM